VWEAAVRPLTPGRRLQDQVLIFQIAGVDTGSHVRCTLVLSPPSYEIKHLASPGLRDRTL
jgi:hypothetical protein